MSNDDRPKLTVVSNDDIEVDENGVLTRRLVLDEFDGSDDFIGGIYVGTIITQLQQCKWSGMELDQLHPMPANRKHVHIVERIAQHFKASVTIEPYEDDADMVWCSFEAKRNTMRVVTPIKTKK